MVSYTFVLAAASCLIAGSSASPCIPGTTTATVSIPSTTTTTTTPGDDDICSSGSKQVCCNGLLACLVQVLGSDCNGNARCCKTEAPEGALINISLLNCVSIL